MTKKLRSRYCLVPADSLSLLWLEGGRQGRTGMSSYAVMTAALPAAWLVRSRRRAVRSLLDKGADCRVAV